MAPLKRPLVPCHLGQALSKLVLQAGASSRCSRAASPSPPPPPSEIIIRVGLFYLRPSLFYLRLVFVAYGQLDWSFLLTVEIRFGLFCLRWKSVWSFLLTVPPGLEIRFGLLCLRFPRPEIEFGLFLLTVSPP